MGAMDAHMLYEMVESERRAMVVDLERSQMYRTVPTPGRRIRGLRRLHRAA
jgi:hypothetical protein